MPQQSNQTGLRVAEESATPKVLPGTPIWFPVEPNSYDDFGGDTKLTPRTPIAADRQKRRGTVTDFDAMAGYQVDLTDRSLYPVMPGFMFANWRNKTVLDVTAVAAGSYTVAAGGAGFAVGDLLFAESMNTPANNGMKVVTASTATSVSVAGAVVEAVTAANLPQITRVGFQFASGDLTLTVSGGTATIGAAVKNLTTLGLIPGEWVHLGGDAAANKLATAASNGFYRVRSVMATQIVCDVFPDNAVTDAGAGKTMHLYIGNVLKNEWDPTLQVIKTYQFERSLNPAGTQLEYVLGACPNTLKIEAKTADKLTASLDFKALDTDTSQVALKSGTRPALFPQSAFSSASDFSRLRLRDVNTNANLAVYMTDLSLTIDNGTSADKALGTLGGIEHTIGDFDVSGSVEAYFSSLTAVQAVKAGTICGIDVALVTNVLTTGVGYQAAGWVFDVPSVQLGDGKVKVEKDKKVKLPVSLAATADQTLNHTLLAVHFRFLPQLAL